MKGPEALIYGEVLLRELMQQFFGFSLPIRYDFALLQNPIIYNSAAKFFKWIDALIVLVSSTLHRWGFVAYLSKVCGVASLKISFLSAKTNSKIFIYFFVGFSDYKDFHCKKTSLILMMILIGLTFFSYLYIIFLSPWCLSSVDIEVQLMQLYETKIK